MWQQPGDILFIHSSILNCSEVFHAVMYWWEEWQSSRTPSSECGLCLNHRMCSKVTMFTGVQKWQRSLSWMWILHCWLSVSGTRMWTLITAGHWNLKRQHSWWLVIWFINDPDPHPKQHYGSQEWLSRINAMLCKNNYLNQGHGSMRPSIFQAIGKTLITSMHF